MTARRGHGLAALGLAGPAVLLVLALLILPSFAVLGIALTDWQFGAPEIRFVGLRNFSALAGDPIFWMALRQTFAFVALTVPLTVVLGLCVALLIDSGRSWRDVWRAVHFLPFMATMAAMALAWEALLHPTIGLVNQTLRGMGLPTANWLRDEATALPVLGAIFVWQNLGFAMVLFLAGLRSIPAELYDAAAVDGADDGIARHVTVTLPLLGPSFMFILIVVSLRAFETFDTVRILTQGGPAQSSEMLLHRLFVESFDFLRTGHGAAIAVVFLGIVVALTLLQARVLDRKVHYG